MTYNSGSVTIITVDLAAEAYVMTPEQTFDRLERIVKLMITAGYRARNQIREQGERINMIIDRQCTKRDLSGMKKDLLCWQKLKPTAIGDWML